MLEVNNKVTKGLNKLADLCSFAGDNRFAIASYRKAADAIEELHECVSTVDVTQIHGIGNGSISKCIAEIIKTGTCEKTELLIPEHGTLLELLQIPGVGYAIARKLNTEHGAKTIDDVRRLVSEGKVKGKRIVEGLNGVGVGDRIEYSDAFPVANEFIAKIKEICGDEINRIETAGSLRRMKATIGDYDFIIDTMNKESVGEKIKSLMDGVNADGPRKISGSIGKMHCDVRFAEPDTYGAMILYFTGSKEHNIMMRKDAIKKGLRLNEYGLWRGEEKLCGSTERDIFEALKIEYVEPNKRGI